MANKVYAQQLEITAFQQTCEQLSAHISKLTKDSEIYRELQDLLLEPSSEFLSRAGSMWALDEQKAVDQPQKQEEKALLSRATSVLQDLKDLGREPSQPIENWQKIYHQHLIHLQKTPVGVEINENTISPENPQIEIEELKCQRDKLEEELVFLYSKLNSKKN